MGKLPLVRVEKNFAFYLAPTGATGDEAIVYLSSYNAGLRENREKQGFKLLSTCRGDFSEGGDRALSITPPSDSNIKYILDTIKSRQSDYRDRLILELAECKEMVTDTLIDAQEKKLYQTRAKQLKRRLDEFESQIPTFQEAKVFFMREHRARLSMDVPQSVRVAMEQMSLEDNWSDMIRQEEVTLEAEKNPPKELVGVAE